MLSLNETRNARSDQNPETAQKTPMAVKEKADNETMEWSAEEEIQLFKALGGLKPIGINKHFYMACICGRLSAALKREISPEVVWAHLHTLYNLDILESIEPLPFPQEQRDFFLPEAEFGALMAKKLQDVAAAKEQADELGEKNSFVGGSGAGDPTTPLLKSRTATPQPQSGSLKPVQSRLSSQSSNSSSKSMTHSSSTHAALTSNATAPNATSAANSASNATTPNNAAATALNATPAIATPALSNASASGATSVKSFAQRDLEKKIAAKMAAIAETPKRSTKRTRGSMSIESNSPSTTPPPTQNKRRRI